MTFYGFIVFGRQKRGETLFISCRCKEWPRLTVLGSFSKCPTGFRAALFAGRASNRNGWDGGDSPVLPDWDAVDSSASPGVPPECAALPAAPGPLLSGFEVGEKPGASPSFLGFPQESEDFHIRTALTVAARGSGVGSSVGHPTSPGCRVCPRVASWNWVWEKRPFR